jgi:hypothetical protein
MSHVLQHFAKIRREKLSLIYVALFSLLSKVKNTKNAGGNSVYYTVTYIFSNLVIFIIHSFKAEKAISSIG